MKLVKLDDCDTKVLSRCLFIEVISNPLNSDFIIDAKG